MCAGAIVNSRIKRVVYGARDAKAGCCGSVTDLFALPFNHRPQVEGGLLEDECAALLAAFLKSCAAGAERGASRNGKNRNRDRSFPRHRRSRSAGAGRAGVPCGRVLPHPAGQCRKRGGSYPALRAARRQYSVQMSLTKRRVRTMFAQVEQTLGPADILVNNAGVAQQKLFTDITAAEWDAMFGVCVKGAFHCCQAALPHMIRQKWGRIINISSMWGQVGASCEVHYSAAKAALIGFTKALAKEEGPSGITGKLCGAGRSGNGYDGCFLPGG